MKPHQTNLYNVRGQVIETRDALYQANFPDLHNTKFEYDAKGYLVKKIESADVAGGTRPETVFTYDSAGRLTSTTDPLGRRVSYAYDVRDRLVKTTYSDGSTEMVEYGADDQANLMVKTTDRNGIATTYRYDEANRIIETRVAAGLAEQSILTCTYLAGTSQKLTETRNGETTTYRYDYANRMISSTVQANANTALATTNEYDQLGRRRSATDAYGRKSLYLYDQNDRVIKTVVETVPNALRAPAFVDNANQRTASHTYRLTRKGGATLETQGTHKVTYSDRRDRFIQRLRRDLRANAKYLITETVYNSEGQALIRTDARGIKTWTEYDTLGRTTLKIVAVGTPSEIQSSQSYDDNSNLIKIKLPRHYSENIAAIEQFSYNGRNLRASHTTAPGTTAAASQSWTYSLDGRPAEHTDFRGNVRKTLYHRCCGRVQASIQRDGVSTFINNTDYKGQTTHSAVVSALAATYHNPLNANTLRETTTRYDGRGRPDPPHGLAQPTRLSR